MKTVARKYVSYLLPVSDEGPLGIDRLRGPSFFMSKGMGASAV